MKKGLHNLAIVVVLSIALPCQQAEAVKKSKLIQMPAFLGLVGAIARVNAAMRSAAQNPQDEFRRRNVRTALQAMPPAIIGLANVFKAGKLHNDDLPMIQALLGGFVDVNAADSYKKFMANPNVALIPKVGAELPSNLMQVPEESGSGSRQQLGFDDSAAKGDVKLANDATVGKDPYAQGVDSAPGLTGDRSPASEAPIASSGSGADNSRGLTFSDRASAQAALAGNPDGVSAPVGMVRDNSSAGRSNLTDVNRDLLAVEAQQASDIEVAGSKASSSLGSDLVLKKPSPADYRMKPKAKYWQFGRLIHQAEALLIHDAHAGEDCKQCQGGGGGGGGGGGMDAAGVLFGMAAMAAAIVPAIVAGEQASADRDIARVQANAQKYMTDSTNANSQRLAEMQQQTAIQTAQMQQAVAQQNNAGVTQRLEMQLASLENARNQAAQAEQQRLALENAYNQQRIALAQKQSDQNVALARSTLSAQLTQAGLSQGTVSSAASGGLAVTPGGASSATSNFSSAIGSDSTAGVVDQGTGRVASLGGMGAMGFAGSNSANQVATSVQPVNASSGGQRLLASLDSNPVGSRGFGSSEVLSTDDSSEQESSTVKKSAGVTSIRTTAVSTTGDRLLSALRTGRVAVAAKPATTKVAATATNLAAGRGIAAKSSDIASFITAAKPVTGGLADFQRHTATARGIASLPVATQSSGHTAPYNAP
jgi:hypothetical protein